MELTKYLPEGLSSDNASLLTAALSMAQQAGKIHLQYFRQKSLEQSTKLNDSDVVTIADKESEKAIISYIHHHFPQHGIIAEESGGEFSNRQWRWVIDPLDGTTNFSMGLPVFSVSIALELNCEAVLGVVYAPYLRECFYAVKGHGSWLNGNRLQCSEKAVLSKAVVATGMPYDRDRNPDNNLAEINRMAMRARGVRRMGSAALDLCYTAAGYLDAYWELNLNLWDIAAGQLIAREAGAIVESIRQDRNHSILASNPRLIASMREVLNRTSAESQS